MSKSFKTLQLLAKNSLLALPILSSLLLSSVNAQPIAPNQIEQGVTLDGQINEDVWLNTPTLTDFAVVNPDTGAKPKHQTKSQILYNEKGLYLAVQSFQPFDTQVERQTSRDIITERDSIRLVLDTSGKGLYGYVFTVALGGSLVDGTVQPEKQFAYEWNAPWQAQTSRHPDRWEAEMFIPWSALKLPSAIDKRTIGVSIERRISYLSEDWAVPAIGKNRSVFLSALLPVEFNVLKQQTELTFVPYFSSSLDRLNKTNDHNFGFDLYYQPTSDSQLSLTVSPDFGQVENDDIVVNFSAFETYTPEKRAFFLEGQEIFKPKGIKMVNTRRIGAKPDAPELNDDQEIDTSKGFSDVIAAGKYTGQLGNTRFGLLTAKEDDSEYSLTDGTTGTIEGREFMALRGVYENNRENNDFYALGYMTTLVGHQNHNASAHMIDTEYRTADEKWLFDSQTYVSDNGEEQGFGQFVQAEYAPEPGRELGGFIRHIDENLDLNDMGYMERNDENRIHLYHKTPERVKSENYRSLAIGQWIDHRFNNKNEHLRTRVGNWLRMQLNDLTRFRLTVSYTTKGWDDKNSRDNGSFRTNDYFNIWSRWQSDTSQKFSYGISGWVREEPVEGINFSAKPFINYAPTDNINIDAELGYKQRDSWNLWQEDDLFNTFKQKQINMTIKSTWIIDDHQELRLAMQWVGYTADSKAAYRISQTGDLYQTGEAKAENFASADLALQLRYKYQFAPLSDLYIVYSRGGDEYESQHDQQQMENQGFGDLLNNSFANKNADQLTMKVRYRF